jgi:N-acetylglucosaminyldiphosphoundecaprenol N-acetyl-beta-D-mannosaminyltransferase
METWPQPDFQRQVYCLLGVPIDALDMDALAQRLQASAATRAPCMLTTVNVNFLITSRRDEIIRRSIASSDVVVADGMPLVWIARLLGLPALQRLAGSSLFERLRADAARPISVFFFGGDDGVAERAHARLNGEARGLRGAGFLNPGFGGVEDMSSDETIGRINASGADFVIISLGARKGQAWIERNRSRLTVPIVSYLGAVVNFAAGRLRRAPAWMQRVGLEWLWRIKEEPALWRRYAKDGAALLVLIVTRVLPLAALQAASRFDAGELRRARVDVRAQEGRVALELHGAWRAGNLAALREAFAAAAARHEDVTLDLSRVCRVDSAFVGLVLVLRGVQWQRRRSLSVAAASGAVRRYFRLCGADYLLDAGDSGGAPRAGELPPVAQAGLPAIRR